MDLLVDWTQIEPIDYDAYTETIVSKDQVQFLL